MKILTRYLGIVTLLFALVIAAPVQAKGRKKSSSAPPPQPTVISSLSADSITISDKGASKTFTLTQFTEITLRGQRAKLTDLQPGMAVSVTLGTDPTKLSRINASDAPAGQPKR